MSKKEALIYGIIASIVAAVLLGLALGEQEYGFYTFLRFFVTAAALLTMYASKISNAYTITIISLAVGFVFNPIVLVSFTAETWHVIDIVTLLYFVVVAIVFYLELQQDKKRHAK